MALYCLDFFSCSRREGPFGTLAQRLTCAPYYQPGEARIRVGDRSLSRFDFRRAAARRDVGLWRNSDVSE